MPSPTPTPKIIPEQTYCITNTAEDDSPVAVTVHEERVRSAPEVLTHFIEGLVIQESSEPFPVSMGAYNNFRLKYKPKRMYFTIVCNVCIDSPTILLFYR